MLYFACSFIFYVEIILKIILKCHFTVESAVIDVNWVEIIMYAYILKWDIFKIFISKLHWVCTVYFMQVEILYFETLHILNKNKFPITYFVLLGI